MHYTVVPHGRSAVGWNGVPGGTSLHGFGCPCLGCCEGYGYAGTDHSENETIGFASGAAYAASAARVSFPLKGLFEIEAGYFGTDNAIREAFRVDRTGDAWPKIAKIVRDNDLEEATRISQGITPLALLWLDEKNGQGNRAWLVDFFLKYLPLPEDVREFLESDSTASGFGRAVKAKLDKKKEKLRKALDERKARAEAAAAPEVEVVPVSEQPERSRPMPERTKVAYFFPDDAGDEEEAGLFGLAASYGGVPTPVLLLLAGCATVLTYRHFRGRS